MAENFVNVDRDTPLLLPADLRQWVPEDDLVHFVISAVDSMHLGSLQVNERGTGSAQYPPTMMLALLLYCYANGIFSSRRIERATWRDVGVRYLTGDTHPDHDTICSFRRSNAALVAEAFSELLRLASEMGLVKVGTLSVDGTQILANASRHKSVRYDRAGELERRLLQDIQELLAEAERQDREDEPDDQALPVEIARREKLREKLLEARRRLEERARAESSHPPNQPGAPREERPRRKPRKRRPLDEQQINLTDADSALMRKSHRDGYTQSYNAQAVVDTEGGQLVVATTVLRTPSDANQLEPALHAVPPSLGEVSCILADGGYLNADAIEAIQRMGIEVYVAITDEEQNVRRYDYRAPRIKPPKRITDPRLVAMREKLSTPQGRRTYRRRAATVEPVFGTIKAALGFRQFLLRGLAKVKLEWQLVCLAYNLRRMHALTTA